MPTVENPLIHGLPISWELVRTDEHLRCDKSRVGCGSVYPGCLMAKVGADGVCEECRSKGDV